MIFNARTANLYFTKFVNYNYKKSNKKNQKTKEFLTRLIEVSYKLNFVLLGQDIRRNVPREARSLRIGIGERRHFSVGGSGRDQELNYSSIRSREKLFHVPDDGEKTLDLPGSPADEETVHIFPEEKGSSIL